METEVRAVAGAQSCKRKMRQSREVALCVHKASTCRAGIVFNPRHGP